jgi:hypothetical protein
MPDSPAVPEMSPMALSLMVNGSACPRQICEQAGMNQARADRFGSGERRIPRLSDDAQSESKALDRLGGRDLKRRHEVTSGRSPVGIS